VSFAVVTLCVASQRVFIVVSAYFVMTQSGNFWIHSRIFDDLTSVYPKSLERRLWIPSDILYRNNLSF